STFLHCHLLARKRTTIKRSEDQFTLYVNPTDHCCKMLLFSTNSRIGHELVFVNYLGEVFDFILSKISMKRKKDQANRLDKCEEPEELLVANLFS
ncbi:unnamed protein product, partial [Cylicocyclus nassatus]